MTQDSSDSRSELLTLLPLLTRTVFSVTDLKEFGHTKTQLLICAALSRSGMLSMSQIARFISSSKEQATRAVAPLVDDGLVERCTDPQNRTRVYIRLTELGTQRIARYKEHIFNAIQKLMWEKLSREEKEELKTSVESVIRILSKLD